MPKAKKKSGYYAVALGHAPGIYSDWTDASAQVTGFAGARHKKFSTLSEAEDWLRANSAQSSSSHDPPSMTKYYPSAAASNGRAQPYPTPASKISNGSDLHPVSRHLPTLKSSSSSAATVWRQVYTDGACPNNGQKHRNPSAGAGVYWNSPDADDISERLPGTLQTNQKAELYGILRAVETDPSPSEPLEILTDSSYSISCLVTWHHRWSSRNWKNADGKPVAHASMLKYILALLARRKGKVKFTHVKGHSDVHGNEMADSLAVAGTRLPPVEERDWDAELQKLDRQPRVSACEGLDFSLDEEDLMTEEELRNLDF